MALQIIKPYIHVEDANGNPYVGAKLYVYLPGTTTLAAIFSDAALSVALPNPLTGTSGSDANGNFPRAYIAAGTYKLRAETSAGVLIWQEDNIDTGLSAGSGALPIASGGTGATTAAAARTNLNVPSNSDLTALASSVTSIQATLQNIISIPQGYLTPTSAVPIITADVTAGTAVYYTPVTGTLLPIYDGVQLNVVSFSELTLTLNANQTANNIYDVFVFKDSGIVTIGTGPAWNTATAGSGARGTGAGTTELTRAIGGIWTNTWPMTARNGATTYAVGANQGTYVGSILIDGTNGQITCHRSYGQSRKWSTWNAYNRVPIRLKAGDGTASWAAGGAGSIRAQNNNSANSLKLFMGLPECPTRIALVQSGELTANQASGATTGWLRNGIGYNATNAFSGKFGYLQQTWANMSASLTMLLTGDLKAEYIVMPAIGTHTITACEQFSNSLSQTLYGTEPNNILSAEWLG